MAKFPVLFAGQRFTATLAGQMEPDYYRKTSATTRASTTTTTSDPDLSIPVDANTIVICEFFIKYATTTAAGFKTLWNVPSGTSGNRQVQGLGTGAVDNSTTSFTARSGVHGFGTSITYGSRNDVSLQVWAYEWAEVTVGATAGAVAIGWGQNASTAVNTAVFAGSFARKTQIG
jgi:hypothetical protein